MKKTDKTDLRKHSKIEPIHITDDVLVDPDMDEFLRRSMIEEADRIEEELNSDPELMGVGASDDLFLKIKEKLQEMGVWEEEEEEKEGPERTAEKEGTAEKTQSQRETLKKTEEETKEKTDKTAAGKTAEKTEEEAPEKSEKIYRKEAEKRKEEKANNIYQILQIQKETLKKKAEILKKEQKRSEKQRRSEEQERLERTEQIQKSGKTKKSEKITEKELEETKTESQLESESETKSESNQTTGSEAEESEKTVRNKEEIYSLLSEEDREALEIGRKVRDRGKKKKRRWRKVTVGIAVVGFVFSLGIQGGANRSWILEALNKIGINIGSMLQIDYYNKQGNIYLNEKKEEEVWEKIKEDFNIPIIKLFYKPKEMKFNDYNILEKTNEIIITYSYKDTLMYVCIKYGNKNSSMSFISEEDSFLQDIVTNNQNIEVRIRNTTTNSAESYTAVFEYQDIMYFFSGQISFEEIKKMMNFMYLY